MLINNVFESYSIHYVSGVSFCDKIVFVCSKP